MLIMLVTLPLITPKPASWSSSTRPQSFGTPSNKIQWRVLPLVASSSLYASSPILLFPFITTTNVWHPTTLTGQHPVWQPRVVNNTSIPKLVLSKKHNHICYHWVWEAIAANIIRIAKEDSATNLIDLLTKPLGLPQRCFLLECILY